ncbi:tyrosine-protein phosphatase non-receptor type substrate 1-like [Engystomops pustulosus]|uniref:tyrosine-protein phosphatase non-receptor type substrate 1-like n=1 Tax=Engystomops pustulosus TaxID=76066 RepID=UPI003AFA697C
MSQEIRYTVYWKMFNLTGHEFTNIIHVTEHEQKAANVDTSLSIDKAKISDNGKYNCTVSRTLPPPTVKRTVAVIQLFVQAHPQMALNYTIDGIDDITVWCSIREFYPNHVNVSLKITCGSVQYLNGSLHILNADGTYSGNYGYLVNISNCASTMTGTCVAEHQTGWFNISAKLTIHKNPDPNHDFRWYIIGGILILLLLLASIIYYTGKRHCSADRSRQNILGSNDVASQTVYKRDCKDENIDVVYMMPNFQRTKTRENETNQRETEYSAIRQMVRSTPGEY